MKGTTAGKVAALVIMGTASGLLAGTKAPDFTLPSVAGEEHSLSQYEGKIVVLEWINYDCPFVRKFYNPGVMQKWQNEATEKGIVWLSICSSAPGTQGNFSHEEWQRRIAAHEVKIPVLLDESGDVGRAYGAQTTPHMYVINPEGYIVYQGAIDSIRSTSADDIEKADNYVRAAIKAVLAGEEVEVAKTRAYGCSVKYK